MNLSVLLKWNDNCLDKRFALTQNVNFVLFFETFFFWNSVDQVDRMLNLKNSNNWQLHSKYRKQVLKICY